MTALDTSRVVWRKSSRSVYNGNCVEVASTGEFVLIRDSKDPAGPILDVPSESWKAFLNMVRDGRPDRLR